MQNPERIDITRAVIGVLDEWGFSDSDQIVVLGLPEDTRTRMIRKFRENTPLPEDVEVDERLEHIAGIADALRTTYPRNARMAAIWMSSPHRRFEQQPPMALILNRGLDGLKIIRAFLDCSFAWEQTD